MKRLLVVIVALLGMIPASAYDYNFDEIHPVDHEMMLSAVKREWRTHNLYTAGWNEKPAIGLYWYSFATAYPNPVSFQLVEHMLGYGKELSHDNVLDTANGYAHAELGTETTPKLQMCYWRCDDGGVLVGVAMSGYEYLTEENEDLFVPGPDYDPEDANFLNLSDLMFYYVPQGEVLWLPRTPEQMLGRKIDFSLYRIQLPRQGKTITLSDSDDKVVMSFTWNGSRFVSGK